VLSVDDRVAIAPGTAIDRVVHDLITTIDTVSAASAVRAADRNGSPPARSGCIVRP